MTDASDKDATTPFPKAPTVTHSVYEEGVHMLFASDLSYSFTDLLILHTKEKIKLTIPEKFQERNLKRFEEVSWDLTEYNDGNGMSFAEILSFVEHNTEVLATAFDEPVFTFTRMLPERTRDHFAKEGKDLDGFFLTFNRCQQREYGLVYCVFKDTINKRAIVSFRGSRGGRDWPTNLNATLEGMLTPKKIKDRMKGRDKDRVLVHRGFYNYLFENRFVKGKQPYDRVIDDLRTVLEGEEGYSVYVTGHSLGGALATLFSFKLAGAGKMADFIPRPVSCMTYAAPLSGCSGFRTAFEHMEKDKLLRCLRVNNDGDIVPAIPPVSILRLRTLKHVGINLRLFKPPTGYLREHSSRRGSRTALRNSIFKPVWDVSNQHNRETHFTRMVDNKKELSSIKLDELYDDPEVVSRKFKPP
mmetsp:Transcript_27822/g.65399  ORF Transcript_27822/g.65399 Transcript_27822/m.65399 type:complete len:414 (-) Transcript_27822:309-1550(-)|eukprot:CAMPEP_0197175742 /NCGR_PEP_ID=MMETSP1423-20130617/1883_1 /TAXON_ID=476441 /ORGANISM="Pseudo-nitzschia heimii, Strain UNC1101" /LENGTH=413 /DNA_ID=CAMNT_0042624973 /DNA_START=134 /DNA_END=1375 /DNA_ORIENTATION=-